MRHTEKTEACVYIPVLTWKSWCVWIQHVILLVTLCAVKVFCNRSFPFSNTKQKSGEEHERTVIISSCLDYNKGKRTDRRHRFVLQSIVSISCKPVTWFSAQYCLNNLELQINDQSCKAGYLGWFYDCFRSPQWRKASKNFKLILCFPSSINWILLPACN